MAGELFNYTYGTQSPGGASGGMNFCGPQSVGGFGQSHHIDASMYASTSPLDSGVDMSSEQDYRLYMEQQPMVGLATDKEKDRKPIDPPPVVRIEVSARKDPRGVYLSNPYCFMTCYLKKITKDESGETQEEAVDGNKLTGSVVSSLHRLRNTENRDVGYFVFADMYPKDPGEYRLVFTLYEMARQGSACFLELATIESASFPVWPVKSFPGLKQSTYLTRAISDQGIRVRLRKDSRQSLSNRRKRHMSLPGVEEGANWAQRRQHVTAPRLGGSPAQTRSTEPPTNSSRTSHSVSPTQTSQQHLQQQQQQHRQVAGSTNSSLAYSMAGHMPSPIATSLYSDSLSSLANPSSSSRDATRDPTRLNNMGLRLPQPQGQGGHHHFLTTPPPTARMGNPNLYTFSSSAAGVLGQNPCYSSADTGAISAMLPIHHQHHPNNSG